MRRTEPQFPASAAMLIISALFWDITRRHVVFTDVSGKRIGPIFKDQESKKRSASLFTAEGYILQIQTGVILKRVLTYR
jgi:hypothetical protein